MISTTDITFMREAINESRNSTCFKREIGAILVSENRIIGKGCNGGPSSGLHSKGNDKLSVKECYYEKLAKKECEKRNIEWGCTESLVIKKEFRLFCLSICAEKASIADAIKRGHGNEIPGAKMYCTTFPCPACANVIRASGILHLYYVNFFMPETLLTRESLRIFKEGNIDFEAIDIQTKQGHRLENYKESPKYYK